MEATDFVKKFGLTNAAYIVKDTELTNLAIYAHCGGVMYRDLVSVADVKRVIESHAIVEKLGGLNSLKAWVKETKSNLSLATYFHCNKPLVLIQIENAEQAIADVEQSI